jgi:lipoic acid synthetase
MLGLGETRDEVEDALDDLRDAGVEIVCLGQYLRPSERHLAVRRFLPPEEFEGLRAAAEAKGFAWVTAGPFVRSSYEADRAAGTLARVERLTTHADKETR